MDESKKDKENYSDESPSVLPGKGMEKIYARKTARLREANFPGGSENAAGMDHHDETIRESVGVEPIKNDKLNFGDDKKKINTRKISGFSFLNVGEKNRSRYKLLNRLENLLELPMVILAFVWLGLMILEFIRINNTVIQTLSMVIWIIFIFDFTIKFIIAPHKGIFLKKNIITLFSLAIPALRVFRIAAALRSMAVVRALGLGKVVGSINRTIRALATTLNEKGVLYVLILTNILIFAGGAGMFYFEGKNSESLSTYGSAIWWTAMLLTTMGTDYWPKSFEGRLLCYLLALYGFAVFGYVTATIASFFIEHDKKNQSESDPKMNHLEMKLDEVLKKLDALTKDRS